MYVLYYVFKYIYMYMNYNRLLFQNKVIIKIIQYKNISILSFIVYRLSFIVYRLSFKERYKCGRQENKIIKFNVYIT